MFTTNSFVWGLQAACDLLRMPFAPRLLLQQFPPPYTALSLQQATQALGMRSAWREPRATDLHGVPMPCLIALNPDTVPAGAPVAGTPSPHRLAVLLKVHADHVLFVSEGEREPRRLEHAEFAAYYAGHAMLIAASSPALEPDREPASRPDEFGFRWFVPELLKHRGIWYEVLLASLAIQLMALATPLCTQIVIDKVIVHHAVNTLTVIALALLLFVVFTAGMTWVRQYLVLHTGNRIDAVLGSVVVERLFQLPPRYFGSRPTGTLVARVHAVETVRDFLTGASVTLILDVPFLLIFLAIMFYYSVTLTAITAAILALIVALSVAITPLLRERINHQFLLGARNQAFLTEYVAGMDTVKSLQMEPQLNARYGEYLAAYLQASFGTRQLSNSYGVAAGTLEQLLTLAILCVGAWLVMTTNDLTIGMLVAFQMFAGRLSAPVLRMVGLWQEFQQASIAVKRLGDIMNVPPEPICVRPSRTAGGPGRIDIEGISFRHAENLPYLYRNFSLVVEPGRCVAIMGPSGSGKSTLAGLLQGFCLPTDGTIRVDGQDIRHLGANELRQYYGVVPQETVLFSGTIYDNLVQANPHATFDDVVAACTMAEIHETVEALPQGYQTPIGEHGAGLSGGQKQRLAIARALIKRPRVLIFDEATSGLDAATVEQFARTVNRLKGSATILFITHGVPGALEVDQTVRIGS